ncbi:MAG: hypothetical protein A2V70_07210 [Planctomycetes bacterium RBG_13_63_9]|nr:MAG: hypothetical protein A2V70_07210 [Planctomycetes bacterium RBG_13_63_9]
MCLRFGLLQTVSFSRGGVFMHGATVRLGVAAVIVSAAAILMASEPEPGTKPEAKPETKSEVETFTGKVVRVTDGDTLTVLAEESRRKIRLAGVDAPELKQPFGDEAKKALSKKLFGKMVEVRVIGKEPDGTALGIVRLEDHYVNVELVREGCAWHDIDANDSPTLAKAEKQARQKKRGLWAEAEAMPPWEWRRIEEAKAAEKTADATGGDSAGESSSKKTGTASEPKLAHWLNASSNIRHNSRCKYYRKTKQGRMCGPNEGRACKTCGG